MTKEGWKKIYFTVTLKCYVSYQPPKLLLIFNSVKCTIHKNPVISICLTMYVISLCVITYRSIVYNMYVAAYVMKKNVPLHNNMYETFNFSRTI